MPVIKNCARCGGEHWGSLTCPFTDEEIQRMKAPKAKELALSETTGDGQQEEKDPVTFALAVLKNVGVDTECGACMEIAFTGVTTNPHDCKPPESPHG